MLTTQEKDIKELISAIMISNKRIKVIYNVETTMNIRKKYIYSLHSLKIYRKKFVTDEQTGRKHLKFILESKKEDNLDNLLLFLVDFYHKECDTS